MEIKIKLLNELAKMPVKQHPDDAGFDLFVTSVEQTEHDPHIIKYGFGIALEIPEGHCALIVPRSSVYKRELQLTNSVGVIDAGYRGEIGAVFYAGIDTEPYQVGDRAAQMLIMPVPDVALKPATELSETTRGNGGFGSTGQ